MPLARRLTAMAVALSMLGFTATERGVPQEQLVEPPSIDGLIVLPTKCPVAEVLARIASLAQSRGLVIFAKVDFSGDAAKSHLVMAPAGMVIFGNPAAGTPVMIAAPTAAIDLPLKILAYEHAGRTWVAFNDPQYLQRRHGFPVALIGNLAPVAGLAQAAAAD